MKHKTLFLLLTVVLLVQPLSATTMLKMDLGELASRSGQIFRGTVVDVEQGTIAIGGGELPAVSYRLKVDEMFKGSADVVKGDEQFIEIRMVGSIKEIRNDGQLVHISAFRDVPRLQMGSDYLLLVTPDSAVGLSTTVGLGQGAFSVYTLNKQTFAVNQFNNAGLGLAGSGPVSYDDLKAALLAALGQ